MSRLQCDLKVACYLFGVACKVLSVTNATTLGRWFVHNAAGNELFWVNLVGKSAAMLQAIGT